MKLQKYNKNQAWKIVLHLSTVTVNSKRDDGMHTLIMYIKWKFDWTWVILYRKSGSPLLNQEELSSFSCGFAISLLLQISREAFLNYVGKLVLWPGYSFQSFFEVVFFCLNWCLCCCSGKLSWEQVLRYTRLRKRYVSLYASLLNSDTGRLVVDDNKEIEKLDRELDIEVILQWR